MSNMVSTYGKLLCFIRVKEMENSQLKACSDYLRFRGIMFYVRFYWCDEGTFKTRAMIKYKDAVLLV